MPSGAVEKNPRNRSETALTRSSRGFSAPFEIVLKGNVFPPVDLAVLDPDELRIVGNYNVLRQLLVATDLLGLKTFVEVFANGLILDIAEDHRRLRDLEVRRAGTRNLFRFVDDADALTGRIEPPRSRG